MNFHQSLKLIKEFFRKAVSQKKENPRTSTMIHNEQNGISGHTLPLSQQLKSHISGHKHKLRCYKKGLAAGSLTLTTDDESRTSQMAGGGGGGRGHLHQRPDRHGRVGPGATGPIASR